MRQPISYRRGIPFYYDKSETEFSKDVYERYDELVTRQTALHLADELHGGYPFQALLDLMLDHLPNGDGFRVADIGCSVGRLAGEIHLRRPGWEVHGIDLSYQMLRQANDYWVKGEVLRPNLARYGWGMPSLQTPHPRQRPAYPPSEEQPRLQFSLARAEDLPFADASLDYLLNTFLLDRVPDPFATLNEFARVLRPGGRMVAVTPLNFLTPGGWRDAHPPVKILGHLQKSGWKILDWQDPFVLTEPMDARGNAVRWSCIAVVAERSGVVD
ncbi:class I SAM-dependent methyltransferase [Lewinella sp. 4G2]|uniref:class I SAM-dependent methyltransferase n=1 Tax=Lewinella sp. 4G2 TaxID=1803372 RepID=UPI0007B4D29D|nr:class I SAM-dependent methyltransferase [Lewinella sp. 4G2]OAV43865.1 hypothetical protein A3850_004845 [Lewinella sp. 4G2]